MDGMLSQDEINALLNGMDLSDNDTDNDTTEVEVFGNEVDENLLSATEKDAIGEVANISLGSSATTLYSLVNRKVNITTPIVTLSNWHSFLEEYERPCVFIQIKYTAGLEGSNILVLKEHDVKVITDLMMGGEGIASEESLGELHLSAISEAMNQMMGSAATSLSTMLGYVIDISPPDSSLVDLNKVKAGEELAPFLGGTFVKIAFRMQIDDLVDSSIMQLYPVDFAKNLVTTFVQMNGGGSEEPQKEAEPAAPPQGMPAQPQGIPAQEMPPQGMPMGGMPMQGYPPQGMPMGGAPPMQGYPPQGMPMQGYPMQGMPMGGMPMQGYPMQDMNTQNVNIQPAQFQPFSANYTEVTGNENIGLIMDVPLEVTVELGRTMKSISDILEFAPGTIIELDKIAGEPIDVLVNGKYVAKGEVVVIEESFGIRVTEIIK